MGPRFYGLEPNEETMTLRKQGEIVEFPEKNPKLVRDPVTVFDPMFEVSEMGSYVTGDAFLF